MKHATPAALDELEPLLASVRALEGLTEKNRGTFYRGSKAFCHFHEDPSGLFADLRLEAGGPFERFRVSTKTEQSTFLRKVKSALIAQSPRARRP